MMSHAQYITHVRASDVRFNWNPTISSMLRRKAKREHSVGLGAFEDRRGSGKKQKLSKAVREEEEEEDEVEEKLGTLVFGKQTPSLGDRGGRDDPSSSEEDSEVSNVGKRIICVATGVDLVNCECDVTNSGCGLSLRAPPTNRVKKKKRKRMSRDSPKTPRTFCNRRGRLGRTTMTRRSGQVWLVR